jgi:sensor histidine kinase YesM
MWALAAYLPLDALTYCLIVMLGHASDAKVLARVVAERESAVRGELATMRLASLRAQLRPHFLFNALNAATVLARRGDADSVTRVLNRLAELLRYVLRDAEDNPGDDNKAMARLGDELDFADSYLAIERERFPDRLRATSEITLDARAALVPHLLLQPLVENAVHHGIGVRVGAGTVTIRAWRIEQVLHVTVENDGPSPTALARDESGRTTHGIGLANTRARLRTLYGDDAALTLDAPPDGGAIAHIVLPYRA